MDPVVAAALIGWGAGMISTTIGAVLNHLLEMRAEQIRREWDEAEYRKRLLTEGVQEYLKDQQKRER